MRATSPLDPLEYLGDPVALPLPKYPVGTCIDVKKLDADSFDYYAKTILREILKRTQRIVYPLKKQGFMKGMQGKKMLPHNKAQIREMLEVMGTAHTVELAGFKPAGMHVTGTVGNQCYLRNGQCHSGVGYNYYLLFRSNLKGNDVVYIHPEPVISECALASLLTSPPLTPTTPH